MNRPTYNSKQVTPCIPCIGHQGAGRTIGGVQGENECPLIVAKGRVPRVGLRRGSGARFHGQILVTTFFSIGYACKRME